MSQTNVGNRINLALWRIYPIKNSKRHTKMDYSSLAGQCFNGILPHHKDIRLLHETESTKQTFTRPE